MNVSKEQFDLAHELFKPNNYIKYAFKYFSRESTRIHPAVYIMIIFFILGLLGTVFNVQRSIIYILTISNVILLISIYSYMVSAGILANKRINKICEYLNVSKTEYSKLAEEFYPDKPSGSGDI